MPPGPPALVVPKLPVAVRRVVRCARLGEEALPSPLQLALSEASVDGAVCSPSADHHVRHVAVTQTHTPAEDRAS